MTVQAMEEHCDAYFLWKKMGVRDAWCWHVDAHLDIGRFGLDSDRLTALKSCSDASEAASRGLMGNSYLPWGGLHCGNYLYPAITEGLVGKLTWVIPPDLPEGGDLLRWSREHLDGWFGLSLQDCASLREEDGRVAGTILGIPFEMGTVEALEIPREPVLMDIDIDYFLNDAGEKWRDAEVLAGQIQGVESLCTTVAYSVKGGYTPTEQRALAAPFLQRGTDGYRSTELDRASTLLRCHKYEEAKAELEKLLESHPIEAGYGLGSSLQKLKQPEQALETYRRILTRDDLPEDGRAYLGGLCAELCVGLERPKEALKHALEAKALIPDDYQYVWAEALAREALGEERKATRLVRTALRLAEGSLFSLKIRWVLSRLYRKQNKAELAKMELRKLRDQDVMGEYRSHTMLVR